jgi:hypothetical protein
MPVANTPPMHFLDDSFVSFITQVPSEDSSPCYHGNKPNIGPLVSRTFLKLISTPSTRHSGLSFTDNPTSEAALPFFPKIPISTGCPHIPPSCPSAPHPPPQQVSNTLYISQKQNHTKTAKMPMQWNDQADARVTCFSSLILVQARC